MYLVCSVWHEIHNLKVERFKKVEKFFHNLDAAKEFAKSLKEREPHKSVCVAKVIESFAY